LIAIAMSRVIRARRERVWRALISPSDRIRWDTRLLSLESPAPGYPAPGRGARWRCRLGSVAVDLRDDPVEVVPTQRLRSAVQLGSFRFEETFTLESDDEEATRLSLRLSASNSVPVVGGELDRFGVRRLSSERVNDTLLLLQRWCETER
jgi:Polyketide cyclase / dehydrase and lipid transport